MWGWVLGWAAALAFSGLLTRQYLRARRRQREEPAVLFSDVTELLDGAEIRPGETPGSHLMEGRYRGLPVRLQTVTDTLNLRKLPSLWLMVTMPGPLPVFATFDLMMRPSGPSTFSNFNLLPLAIDRPPDFPEDAVVRTDDPQHLLPPHVVRPHLAAFATARGKELLISPKGLRMVVQLGEADRARYGVFRQAEFGDTVIARAALCDILDRMAAIRDDVIAWQKSTQ